VLERWQQCFSLKHKTLKSIAPTFYKQIFALISFFKNITNPNCKRKKLSYKIAARKMLVILNTFER